MPLWASWLRDFDILNIFYDEFKIKKMAKFETLVVPKGLKVIGWWWWVVAYRILLSAPVPLGLRTICFRTYWGWAYRVLGPRVWCKGLTIKLDKTFGLMLIQYICTSPGPSSLPLHVQQTPIQTLYNKSHSSSDPEVVSYVFDKP